MIKDLDTEARRYGFNLHMGKTVVMTNVSARPVALKCGDQDVRVLQGGQAEKYLGRKLSMDEYHAAELDNRIASGWAAFSKHKFVLSDRRLPLQHRLKLFQSTVSPCVLYGAGTWTLLVDQERRLRTTQRRMLRQIVDVRRRPDEDWVDFIKRATNTSVDLATKSGVGDWVETFWKAKWSLAGRVASATDGRWCNKLLDWRPWHRVTASRRVGGQRKRWRDV